VRDDKRSAPDIHWTALPRSRYPLFNDLPAKLYINEPQLGALDCFAETPIRNSLALRKSRKWPRFENPQQPPSSAMNYSTMNYSSHTPRGAVYVQVVCRLPIKMDKAAQPPSQLPLLPHYGNARYLRS
jgi:hypothetical protein